MAEKQRDIQKVGDLYRGMTGLKKSDRAEDQDGLQKRAQDESTFQADLDSTREKELRAQQEAQDKLAKKSPTPAPKKAPAKKTAAKKTTAKKAPAKKTAAKKS